MPPATLRLRSALMAAALGASALGCSSEAAVSQPAQGQSGATMATVLTFATFGRSCLKPEPPPPGYVPEEGEVIHDCWAKRLNVGQAEGVDVDGTVSTGLDLESCGKIDLVSPEGLSGIDNQFEELVGMVEGLEGPENVNALLEGAIKNGQLLILMVVDGVDDPLNDPEVSVRMGAGLGAPLLDNINRILPYQTFGFNTTETPVSPLATASIVDGILTAGPADVVLPVRVLDANFNLNVQGARARMVVEHDELRGGIRLRGVVGGGVGTGELESIVQGLNVSQQIQSAVGPFVRGLADLAPDADGKCQQISAMLRVESTSAFLME